MAAVVTITPSILSSVESFWTSKVDWFLSNRAIQSFQLAGAGTAVRNDSLNNL